MIDVFRTLQSTAVFVTSVQVTKQAVSIFSHKSRLIFFIIDIGKSVKLVDDTVTDVYEVSHIL